MARQVGDIGGNLLMVFVKNAVEGKVKTRLAKDIGDTNALKIYHVLLEHTRKVSIEVPCFRLVIYSEFIDFNDRFQNSYFMKDQQQEGDLGQRLEEAFDVNFEDGYDKIVCIGSDCHELNSAILEEAFLQLDKNDLVLGPAKDGGYYLIGMKKTHNRLFRNKEWSTPNILLDTLLDVKEMNLSYHLLPTLSDVDVVDDLNEELRKAIEL